MVKITYPASPSVSEVIVTGTFDNWNKSVVAKRVNKNVKKMEGILDG